MGPGPGGGGSSRGRSRGRRRGCSFLWGLGDLDGLVGLGAVDVCVCDGVVVEKEGGRGGGRGGFMGGGRGGCEGMRGRMRNQKRARSDWTRRIRRGVGGDSKRESSAASSSRRRGSALFTIGFFVLGWCVYGPHRIVLLGGFAVNRRQYKK